MAKLNDVYKCNVCGHIIVVLHEGVGTLVCCGKPMEKLVEKSKDTGSEKHVPVIEKTKKGVLVKVGSVPHPMEKEHYIEWVELTADGNTMRVFLKPGSKPEAEFYIIEPKKLSARIYCNVHGLWKS